MSESNFTRRDFLRSAALAGAGAILPSAFLGCAPSAAANPPGALPNAQGTGWDQVPGILARIRPPTFPARDFVITQYGAVGNGTANASGAIRKAVEACAQAGGGRVVVPAGRFLTGPIHLRSNVKLHVQKGGTLAFSRNPQDYLPAVFTRWEGVEMMGYSPFIYAFEQENIAITGEGTLDGQASPNHWWPWKGAKGCEGPPLRDGRAKGAGGTAGVS
jgi:polygalacturonase